MATKSVSELIPVMKEIGNELMVQKINILLGKIGVYTESGQIFRAKQYLKEALDLLEKGENG